MMWAKKNLMTTTLSRNGQLLLPAQVRRKLRLSRNNDFEITVEDEDTIRLRRVSNPPNHGLVDLLAACPAGLVILPREKDDSEPLAL
jgi:AbrB family looped-hinge helix DNA binding protein